jgi:hypothetical protein
MCSKAGWGAQRLILVSVLAVVALAIAGDQAVLTSESPQAFTQEARPAVTSEPQAGSAPHAAGLKVFVDLQTGQVVTSPSEAAQRELQAAIEAEMGDALSTSSEGLSEVASPVPGGGVMVDLQGRFQSAATATVGPEGIVVGCRGNTPGVGHGGH